MNILGKIGNVFSKILYEDASLETRLGMPSKNGDEALRRAQRMFTMTRGNGFRVYPDEPRKDSQGRTRGDRKRALRHAAAQAEIERQRKEAERLVVRGLSPAAARMRFGSLK